MWKEMLQQRQVHHVTAVLEVAWGERGRGCQRVLGITIIEKKSD